MKRKKCKRTKRLGRKKKCQMRNKNEKKKKVKRKKNNVTQVQENSITSHP